MATKKTPEIPEAFAITTTDGQTRQLKKPTYTTIAEFYEGGFVEEVKDAQTKRTIVVIGWTPKAVIAAIASLVRQAARERVKAGEKDAGRFLTDAEIGDMLDPDQADTYLHIARSFFEVGYDPEAQAPAG